MSVREEQIPISRTDEMSKDVFLQIKIDMLPKPQVSKLRLKCLVLNLKDYLSIIREIWLFFHVGSVGFVRYLWFQKPNGMGLNNTIPRLLSGLCDPSDKDSSSMVHSRC